MALDATRLTTAIALALAADPIIGCPASAATTAFASAIATAVIAEITGHAVVLPTELISATPGDPVTGFGQVE